MPYEIRVRIEPESDPINPREAWDHVGTMVCWHWRYALGDEQPDYDDPQEFLRALAYRTDFDRFEPIDDVLDRCAWKSRREAIVEAYRERAVAKALAEHYVILPLYLYDHGGITISTGPFSCPWDSGQVGFIYCTMEQARREWNGTDEEIRAQAERYLQSEVKGYDQYLTGDVWGYVVERVELDDDGDVIDTEELDSCWGFYGREYCEEEAEAVAEAYRKDAIAEAEEAAVLAED